MTRASWACGLPLACLVGVEIYVGAFDGWGAWAAAPLLLVPALLSLGIVCVGAIDLFSEIRAGHLTRGSVAFVAIGALPIAWL